MGSGPPRAGRPGLPGRRGDRQVSRCRCRPSPSISETVDVGAGLKVHQGGIKGGKVSLSWQAVSGTQLSGGKVWIYQAGVEKPVLFVPQQNPNAVLIPELFAALR